MIWKACKNEIPNNTWRVDAIDYEGDGRCYLTIFYGPDAEERAREYAAFKNRLETFHRMTDELGGG